MPLWGSSSSFDRANADASLLSNGDGQVRLEEYPQKGKSSTVVDEHEVGGDTVSTWKVGWQTPTLMFSCYLIAIFVAVSHCLMFVYLEGKPAEGPDRIAPQSYVATASNILANGFGAFLRAALAVAFAQYLWHILRISTLKVSTIETLFCIRSNPFLLLNPIAIRSAPVLFCIAVLVWTMQIIVAFPPGALTIVSSNEKMPLGPTTVPTFNASFMGNGSGADAMSLSMDYLFQSGSAVRNDTRTFVRASSIYNKAYPVPLQRLAVGIMINGRPNPMPSPCGANCSYTIEFEGPYLKCERTLNVNIAYKFDDNLPQIYRANVNISSRFNGPPFVAPPKYSTYYFNSTVLYKPSAFLESNRTLTVTSENLICRPFRAMYTLTNRYVDNTQSLNISAKPIEQLVNLEPIDEDGNSIEVPGFSLSENGPVKMPGDMDGYGNIPANWSQEALAWYRDVNIMNIIGATLIPLVGAYRATPFSLVASQTRESELEGGSAEGIVWVDQATLDVTTLRGGPLNGTVIGYTRFNSAFEKYTNEDQKKTAATQVLAVPSLSFNITEDLLNSLLMNVTLSTMVSYALWNTSTDATVTGALNVYSFSRPVNLYVPYGLSLFLALLFIILGALALRWNGVAAADGGFVQLITTTTASNRLNNAAAGGCLGGTENVPRKLQDLKVRFGEIVEEDGARRRVRRAGLGVDDEVLPLDRKARYGYCNGG